MRWSVFAVAAYLALGAQFGLFRLFETDHGYIEPRLVLLLAVYVGLWAPPQLALIGWAVLGLGLDLITTWPAHSNTGEGPVQFSLIGPYTLGYLSGGFVLLSCRGVLMSRHPLAMGSMVLVCGLAVQLVVVGLMSARMWYDQPMPVFSPTSQLLIRSAAVMTTAVVAVPLAIPMNMLAPMFGFDAARGRRSAGRMISDPPGSAG